MPKNKPHKGLLKRIRVTKSGRVKMPRAFGRHLRSHKSGALKQSYRKSNYAKACDLPRLQVMLGLKVSGGRTEKPADAAPES